MFKAQMTDSSLRVSQDELDNLKKALAPLIGIQFKMLTLPKVSLLAFEPSQIGSIVGALMDAMIPHLRDIPSVGLEKHEGILGEREGYPDYKHVSGFRVELKLLYVDNPEVKMKKPPTPREPSARLTQKVTTKNVDPARDALLVLAYQLKTHDDDLELVSPTIIDLEVFSMIELVEARDQRMEEKGGKWFGHYETPTILSKSGKTKKRTGEPLDMSSYGRKSSEGRDFNEDTNFGKLKRIPHPRLEAYLIKHRLMSNQPLPSVDEVAKELDESTMDEDAVE